MRQVLALLLLASCSTAIAEDEPSPAPKIHVVHKSIAQPIPAPPLTPDDLSPERIAADSVAATRRAFTYVARPDSEAEIIDRLRELSASSLDAVNWMQAKREGGNASDYDIKAARGAVDALGEYLTQQGI